MPSPEIKTNYFISMERRKEILDKDNTDFYIIPTFVIFNCVKEKLKRQDYINFPRSILHESSVTSSNFSKAITT